MARRPPTLGIPDSASPLGVGRFIVLALMLLAVLALAAQAAIDFSTTNLAAASIAFASSMAMLLYLLWTPAIHTHPVSTFALLGLCVTTQLGALVGQSLWLTALADNLRRPVETFATLAAVQGLAIVTHAAYRTLLHRRDALGESLPRRALRGLGLYAPPGTGALWFMGYIGLIAFVVGGGREGTFFKILQGISFLTWAPFLIPMYLLEQGRRYCDPRWQYPHLALFMALVVLLGLATNARQVMLSGFVTIALFGLLLALRSTQPIRAAHLWRAGIVAVALAAVAIPVSDLATAMASARKARGYISAPQMVQETLRHYREPERLQAERERVAREARTRYDEYYFANPLVARLVETKFHDNALYFGSLLSPDDVALLAQTTSDFLVAQLPQPAIDLLGLDVDKEEKHFSMGDYLAHLSTGMALGGYRTGSLIAQGLALFGIGFVVFYAAVCLMAFAVLDLLSYRGDRDRVLLSAVAMLAIWKIFQYGLMAESLHTWLGLYLRGLPQNVMLFLAFAAVARVFDGVLGGRLGTTTARRQAPVGQAG